MIIRKLFKEGLTLAQHMNTQNIFSRFMINNAKQQTNLSLLINNINFTFSQKKQNNKKKHTQINQTNQSQSQGVDLSTLSKNQQFATLKEGIYELIDGKQDNASFMDVLQAFSNYLTSHNRIKDGIIQFGQIVKKMKTVPIFKLSPNYHYSLCEYRYFLVRAGRIEQAKTICEDSLRLLRKGAQRQSLHVANQLGTFGVVQFMSNDYEQSRRLLQKQDKINQKLSDQTFTEYIDCKNNLAIVDFIQGKYEQAEKTFDKNTQLTKRILKSTKKGKQKLYAKHLVYLQAITEMKITQSKSEQEINSLKLKVNDLNKEVLEILTDNNNAANDLYLYYETVAQHFLKNNQNQLCIKFIQKAIKMNEKKIERPSLGGKKDRSVYEITNTISKHYYILGNAYINLKQFGKANDCYLRAFNMYKKNIASQQAKQMLTLQNFTTFIQCCRSLFELQFIQENKNKKSFEQAIKYMQQPLLVWNEAFINIWSPPQWLGFVPYQLNIEIGIKLLENKHIDAALIYFQACSKEIANSKNISCEKSRKSIGELAQKIQTLIEKLQVKQSQNYQTLKTISDQLNSFSKI